MTIIEAVIEAVSYEQYYQSRFPKWQSKYKLNVYCPWHEKEGTNKPSLALGLRNGGARCHGCGKSIGNIVHFESELKEITELEAATNLYEEFVHPFFPSGQVQKFSQSLQFHPAALEKLAKDLGIGSRTAKYFNLGWDSNSHRIIFPVQTRFGKYGNVRFYKLPSDRTEKDVTPKIYNAKGYGRAELYPWEHIKTYSPDQPLIWMKAERDTLLAIQGRLQAFSITGTGETASFEPWVEEFKDYEIFIVPDNDAEGEKQADKRLVSIEKICKLAKIVDLPFSKKSKSLKDYSDWVLKDGGSAQKLLELIETEKSQIETEIPEVDYHSHKFLSLSEIKNSPEIRDVRIRTKGIIVGRLDRSYLLPNKFKIKSKTAPSKICEVPISRELISMLGESDKEIEKFVKEKVLKRNHVGVEPIEYVSATQVEISPIIDITSESNYVTYNGIFIGNNLETNVPYELEIIPTSSLHTQEQVGIVVAANPISTMLDTQVFQKIELSPLEVFRSDEDCWESLCNFANEISLQYTRIYNRMDWHIVALLTYLSPLTFKYPNEGVQRGWINSLAIGDTQTGKSQVAHTLQRIFNCGAVVNAENCTFVGLVGGTVKNSGGQFMLRWGRIPVNDRQLVVIEELSGLTTAEISRMSEVRSSGIARIDKGGITAETTARTRLLVLSNVRGMGKALGSYPLGLRAVSELVGQAEDVSRFDLIVTLTDQEVSSSIINQKAINYDDLGAYAPELLQKLVRFIWSLKPEQIKITDKAYFASLQITQEMAVKYHPSIPIFKAGSGRHKLTRLACAIACSQFNWDGQQIVVEKKHVICARKVLEMLYDKASFGYLSYSQKQFGKDLIKDEKGLLHRFNEIFRTREKRRRILHHLEVNGRFSERELSILGVVNEFEISKFIAVAVDSNIVERAGERWAVTSVGKIWIDKTLKL